MGLFTYPYTRFMSGPILRIPTIAMARHHRAGDPTRKRVLRGEPEARDTRARAEQVLLQPIRGVIEAVEFAKRLGDNGNRCAECRVSWRRA